MNTNRTIPLSAMLKTIFLCGLLAGTLDICAAIVDNFIQTQKTPEGIFKYIASAVYGKEAFSGGTRIITMGVIFHYIIAFGFTALFYFLFRWLKLYRHNWVLVAFLYGIFIWLMMNIIIVPMTQAPAAPITMTTFTKHTWKVVKQVLILVFMIGIPLSYIFREHYHSKNYQ